MSKLLSKKGGGVSLYIKVTTKSNLIKSDIMKKESIMMVSL